MLSVQNDEEPQLSSGQKEGYILLKYRVNVMEELKNAGYSGYFLEKNKVFSPSALQKFRHDIVVGIETLNRLCTLLQCQPGDLLVWIPDNEAQADDTAQ